MTNPTIAVAVATPQEKAHLLDLRRDVRRVHKSLPPNHPTRRTTANLSELLAMLHRRGVPLKTLAELTDLSHQAIRMRVRMANPVKDPDIAAIESAPKLDVPTRGTVLVVDTGVHRRVHIYDPPEEVGGGILSMLTKVPLLTDIETTKAWLCTEGDTPELTFASTPLRTPTAVYLTKELVDTVLVALTPE